VTVLVEVAGQARGGADFATWLCCFLQDETVNVKLGGLDLGPVAVDASGGIYISVPVPVLDTTALTITATATTTGAVVTKSIARQSPFATPGIKSKAKIDGSMPYSAGMYSASPAAGDAKIAAEVQIEDNGRINGSIHLSLPATSTSPKLELESTNMVRFQRSGTRFVLEATAKIGSTTGYRVTVVADQGRPGSAAIIVDGPSGDSTLFTATAGLTGQLVSLQPSGRVTAEFRS
jgi:hypothetical protein